MYDKIIEELEAEKGICNKELFCDWGKIEGYDKAIEIVRKHAESQPKGGADLLKRGKDIEAMHPYRIVGNHDTYSQYNEAWSDCADLYMQLLEERLPAQPHAESQDDEQRKFEMQAQYDKGFADGRKDALKNPF